MHFSLQTLRRSCADFYGNRSQRLKGGLVLGLLLLLVALTGRTVVDTALSERRLAHTHKNIAMAYQSATQAFYAAEAGLEEARVRLWLADGAQQIADAQSNDPAWQVILRTAGTPSTASKTITSLQEDLHYTVDIRHLTTTEGDRLLRWGDDDGDGVNTRNPHSGEILYRLTSQGFANAAQRTIEADMVHVPVLTVPGALYAGGPGVIQGPQTTIVGLDSCGAVQQAGIRTPLPAGAIALPEHASSLPMVSHVENPTIQGSPAVAYDSRAMNIRAMINLFKEQADVVYGIPTTRQNALEAPPPGSHWGTPRLGADLLAPSACREQHIVYYHAQGQRGLFSDGVAGCGLLLLDGDMEIRGDFRWHGVILVAGSLRLSSGGAKHLTGGLLVEGNVVIEAPTTILYCSEAIQQQTRTMPLRVLRWQEVVASGP